MIPDTNRKRAIPEPSVNPTIPDSKALRFSSIFDHPHDLGGSNLQEVVKDSLSQLKRDPFGSGMENQRAQIKEAAKIWSRMASGLKTPQPGQIQKIKKLCKKLLMYVAPKYQEEKKLEIMLMGGSIALNEFYLQILCTESDFLDRMLQSSMTEAKTGVIDFTNQPFDKDTFSCILRALDNQSLIIPPEHTLSFFTACDVLLILDSSILQVGCRSLAIGLYHSTYDLENLIDIHAGLLSLSPPLNLSINSSIDPLMLDTLLQETRIQIVKILIEESFEIIGEKKILLNGVETELPLEQPILEAIKDYQEKKEPKKSQADLVVSIYLYLRFKVSNKDSNNFNEIKEEVIRASVEIMNDEVLPPTIMAEVTKFYLLCQEKKEKKFLGNLANFGELEKVENTMNPRYLAATLYNIEQSQEHLRWVVEQEILDPKSIENDINHITAKLERLTFFIDQNPDNMELRSLRARYIYRVLEIMKGPLLDPMIIDYALNDLSELDELIKSTDDYRNFLLKGFCEENVLSIVITFKHLFLFKNIPINTLVSDMNNSFKEAIKRAPQNKKAEVVKDIQKAHHHFLTSFDNRRQPHFIDKELVALYNSKELS